jgi:hypothetical protein
LSLTASGDEFVAARGPRAGLTASAHQFLSHKTPRYDYNQVLYKLELVDEPLGKSEMTKSE